MNRNPLTHRTMIVLAALAASAIMARSVSAAIVVSIDYDQARGVGTNGFIDTPPTHRVGQGGSSARFAAIAVFSVQDILTETGLSVAELATSDFYLTFDTQNAVELPSAGTYTVAYRGFVANGDTGPNAFWTTARSYNELTSPSTGVADTLALQTGITSPTFNLTGITESDTANDYVIVGIGYSSSQPTGNASNVGNFKLNVQVIPTPAALPAGIAMLGLATMRRRRK